MHTTKLVKTGVQSVQMSCNQTNAAHTLQSKTNRRSKATAPFASLHSHSSLVSGWGGSLGLGLVSLACLTRPAAAVCTKRETCTNDV